MIRAFISFTILLLTIIVVGCKSQRIDAPESVVIDGKVIYGPDGSPLRQTVITRVSDGKTFLTDTLGNFHIEAQTGDSLRFSYVGTIGRTFPILKNDTPMTVELEPFVPGNDEYVYNEKYFGEFKNQDDGSTLVISRGENGYNVSIKLFRLTEINDCIGKFKEGTLVFTGLDASGKPISGTITVEGDSAKLVFTDSTWEYLPVGTSYTFERKHGFTQKFYSTADGMTMKIVSPSPIIAPVDSIVLEFTNSRNVGGMTGEWFRIDKKSPDGNWQELPYDRRSENADEKLCVVFNAVGWIVRPDTTFQMTVKPWFYKSDWDPGTYRVAKTFHYPPYPIQKSDTAYIEFQIR